MKISATFKGLILLLMGVVSLTNSFGIPAAGISVILGVIGFFVFKFLDKQSFKEYGLDFKSILNEITKSWNLVWILLPLVMNFIVIFLAQFILPSYVEHVVSRSEGMLNVSNLPMLIVQLFVLAFVEEISWRGFFQKQVSSYMSFIPALFITSVLFSLGHLSNGSLIIVIYDLFFIFVNSLIYGNIFRRTNNVWISTISHFLANLFAVIILFLL